jgi:hypothetical protein
VSAVDEGPAQSDMHRKRRAKNRALMLALFAFVVIVYLVTIVRMSGG